MEQIDKKLLPLNGSGQYVYTACVKTSDIEKTQLEQILTSRGATIEGISIVDEYFLMHLKSKIAPSIIIAGLITDPDYICKPLKVYMSN